MRGGDQPTEPRRRPHPGGDRADANKAQLAREVCAASAAFASCAHRRRPRRPCFVDWYLVLAIGEAASEDAIRRRYRQLALQLHPDKNRHPEAEVAFKVVSEAHACLTDKARRRAFDAERRASFCAACHDRHVLPPPPTPRSAAVATDERTAKPRARMPPAASQAQALRDVQQSRMRDECRVIDRCLRANDAAACARRRQSFPLFDPSDRRSFPGYPHTRPPPSTFGDAELRRFEEHLGAAGHRNQRWRRCGGESPVYQIRTAPPEPATGIHRSW